MTLHWWMHWFWVTLPIVACLPTPLPPVPTVTETILNPSVLNSTVPEISFSTTLASDTTTPSPITTSASGIKTTTTTIASITQELLSSIQRNLRIAKAIGVDQQQQQQSSGSSSSVVTAPPPQASNAPQDPNHIRSDPITDSPAASTTEINVKLSEESKTVGPRKNSRLTGSKISKIKLDDIAMTPFINNHNREHEIMTVMPLQEVEAAKPKNFGVTGWGQVKVNHSDEIKSSGTIATVKEVGINDTTSRFGRAHGTFDSEDQISSASSSVADEQLLKNDLSTKEGPRKAYSTATEIAAITGSCLAMLILLSTVGSVGFIMYRKKYLNPPQTLNSDKCSNPDSSGYIDDSTIRDNSEEMYSLDNDSFLNSLEAMTIQNYWTDSVKHTKL